MKGCAQECGGDLNHRQLLYERASHEPLGNIRAVRTDDRQ